jgi:hypothetical protein
LIVAAWRAYRQSLRVKPTALHEAAIERAFHAGWYAAADRYAPPLNVRESRRNDAYTSTHGDI